MIVIVLRPRRSSSCFLCGTSRTFPFTMPAKFALCSAFLARPAQFYLRGKYTYGRTYINYMKRRHNECIIGIGVDRRARRSIRSLPDPIFTVRSVSCAALARNKNVLNA